MCPINLAVCVSCPFWCVLQPEKNHSLITVNGEEAPKDLKSKQADLSPHFSHMSDTFFIYITDIFFCADQAEDFRRQIP